MEVDWRPLQQALAQMRTAKVALPIWWRDDDAVADTAALDRLARTGADLGVPVHIAVIPDLVEPSLVERVRGAEDLIPMVHGWRHHRHMLKGKKDTEFGIRRPGDTTETARALDRMQGVFETDLLPIFVPPWNQLADSLLAVLAAQGYVGVSAFTPRRERLAAQGLVRVNAHVDPIDWRGTRGLVDPAQLVAQTVEMLNARLSRAQDRAEPLGFLTHHLVHTEEVWTFSQHFLAQLLEGGATPLNLRNCKGDLP